MRSVALLALAWFYALPSSARKAGEAPEAPDDTLLMMQLGKQVPEASGNVSRTRSLAKTGSSAITPEEGIYTNAPTLPAAEHSLLLQSGRHEARGRLSQAQKDALLQQHNMLRSSVSKPCTAADMETMAWDESLAAAAQRYADQCVWAHDPTNHVHGWGENLATEWSSAGFSLETTDFPAMVQRWYDEIVDTEWTDDYTRVTSIIYGDPGRECQSHLSGTNQCMIGHYTQVVWAQSNRLGCAATACQSGLLGRGGIMLVCKYTPAGNMGTQSGLVAPYVIGSACAACPLTCENGMCPAGSPNRCQDDITTMTVNGVPYTDCPSLIGSLPSWCANYEGQYKLCRLTCGVCSVPEGLGIANCKQIEITEPTEKPSTTTALHPCRDGSHSCDTGQGGICYEQGESFSCDCKSGYVCVSGCDNMFKAHKCDLIRPSTTSQTACENSPISWTDSSGDTCDQYVQNKWCSPSGLPGSAWRWWWGTLSMWGSFGISASEACCGCGGGKVR